MNSYKKKLTHRIVALALAVAMGSLTPASIYANEKTEMSTTTEVSTTTKMSATTEASRQLRCLQQLRHIQQLRHL